MTNKALKLKLEQAARNRITQALNTPPARDLIEACTEFSIPYQLVTETEYDLADEFPNGDTVKKDYPRSEFSELTAQLMTWPLRQYEIVDPAGLEDVVTGDWMGNTTLGVYALTNLLTIKENLAVTTVSIQSDIRQPIVLLRLGDVPKILHHLLSTTADVYLLGRDDNFITHFCRHGKWVFGKKKS